MAVSWIKLAQGQGSQTNSTVNLGLHKGTWPPSAFKAQAQYRYFQNNVNMADSHKQTCRSIDRRARQQAAVTFTLLLLVSPAQRISDTH